MSGEFQSIVCHNSLDRDSFRLVPPVCSSHEVCKCLGSLIRNDLYISYTGSIIDDSCPVFLLLWILSLDVLHLMEINMYHLSCHSLLIPYDTCFSCHLLQESEFLFEISRKLVSKIRSGSALVDSEVSETTSLYDLSDCITMHMMIGCHSFIELFFLFSFGHSHLFIIISPYPRSRERGNNHQFVHIGKWL